MDLTDKEIEVITREYRNYDIAMCDGWRNDFEEDGAAADDYRFERMMDNIRGQIPDVSDEDIEKYIDTLR